MKRRTLVIIALFAAFVGPSLATAAEPTREELLREVEKLKAEVDKLSAIVEGTAHPINLGRTDLAAVSSSGINGGRADNDIYYGVQNAFDDGANRRNGISYSYWLSAGAGARINIRFIAPVSIDHIVVDGPACTPVFTFAKGGEEAHAAITGEMRLAKTQHGVSGLRLEFSDVNNAAVHEVRIMGYPPPDAEYKVVTPRIEITAPTAESIARAEFQSAGFTLNGVTVRQVEKMDRFEIVFHHAADELNLFRVIVHKPTGHVETTKLARFVEIPGK